MSETQRCYRFVENDLSSVSGELSWQLGEWNTVRGELACCSNGLHAALTPRNSLRQAYGHRWFIAEAHGEQLVDGTVLVAREMRLVKEIPPAALKAFAVWCAVDCLPYYEDAKPGEPSVRVCLETAERFLAGAADAAELAAARDSVAPAASAATGAAGRTVAATISAALTLLAPNTAAWAASAAEAAYAAHLAAAALDATQVSVEAQSHAHNVATAAEAAALARNAATAASRAAAAAARAHAAAVCAARGSLPIDAASDAYFSSFAAFSALEPDPYYEAQNEKLAALIAAE